MSKKKYSQRTVTDNELKEYQALMSMIRSGNDDLREMAYITFFEKLNDFIYHFLKKEFPSFYDNIQTREILYSCCKVAIMEALENFDPTKSSLTNWVTFPMRHHVMDWINREVNNASAYHSKYMMQVEESMKKLQSQGKPCTAADIAFDTGLSVKRVENTLKKIEQAKITHYESNEELENIMPGHTPGPEQAYMEAEAKKIIAEALSVLPDMDKQIILLYFGLDGGDPRSYASVGKLVGISAPQVQTSIARSLRVLRGNNNLRVMFGQSTQSYRQQQLDNIEISLVMNENISSAYNCLDDNIDGEIKINVNTNVPTTVMLTF